MRKFLAVVLSGLLYIAALLCVASKFLPLDTIIESQPWLSGLRSLVGVPIAAPIILFCVATIIAIFLPARGAATEAIAYKEPDRIYRADNLDIRARVRDLLHLAWGGPLVALVLYLLPVAIINAVIHIVLQPIQILFAAIRTPIIEFFDMMGGAKVGLMLMASGNMPEFAGFGAAAMKSVPGLAALLVAAVFVFEPMRVSLADYFIKLLCGKRPKPVSVYSCFSAGYKRVLIGMAYNLMWMLFFVLFALVGAPAVYVGGIWLINAFPEVTTPNLLFLVPSLVALTIITLVVSIVMLFNRFAAYSFTPCALASQPRLAPTKATRASRYLARSRKKRVYAMWLSYLAFFIPAICALLLRHAIAPIGEVFGFTEYLSRSLNTFLLAVAALNAVAAIYVLPVSFASFFALYLETKREFRATHPTLDFILGIGVNPSRQSDGANVAFYGKGATDRKDGTDRASKTFSEDDTPDAVASLSEVNTKWASKNDNTRVNLDAFKPPEVMPEAKTIDTDEVAEPVRDEAKPEHDGEPDTGDKLA